MADSKRESREVGFKVSDGCGNEACYCDGSCREGKARDLTIKVTADVNDAITGFKALSRELREATKVARELEQAYYSAAEAYKDESGRLSFITTSNHSIYLDGKNRRKGCLCERFRIVYSSGFERGADGGITRRAFEKEKRGTKVSKP